MHPNKTDVVMPNATAAGSAFVSATGPSVSAFVSRLSIASSLRPYHCVFRRASRHVFTTPTMMKDTMASAPPTVSPNRKPGIQRADLRQEMMRSYMEYAMSVIYGRAMPDVRDGLKPVHRRILFAMHQLGLAPSGPFRKSARVVGEVLGKYHPHGDTAVYDSLVRMAQTFSMSIPLVNGHGNFGSTDGDPPAAMRYTECKLTPISRDTMLTELDRDTVSLHANFDGSEEEPLVLPVRYPNLLVNGSSGIAVGMATNIPPHNLNEILRAVIAIIENPEISDDMLFNIVPGPDFPTGGQILGTASSRLAYTTGRGGIVVRACVHPEVIEPEGGRRTARDAIIVTQLPYQVNKATLVAKIAQLVNEKKLDGVSDLRDESDRNGTRVVIELKRDALMPIVLHHLFKKTNLESSFSANMMALDNGRFPKLFSLRECLLKFVTFRRETVRRRMTYDLKQADNRLHLVQGFVTVQQNVDAVVALIRGASDVSIARDGLQSKFDLSERQATAVLDLQLRRLTALEVERLEGERSTLEALTTDLRETLEDSKKIDNVIIGELRDIGSKFKTERRSTIVREDLLENVDELSLLSNDQNVITVTQQGYIKRMATSMFVSQNRGTRGKRGVGRLRVGDQIEHLFTCMTHDTLIAVSSNGTAYPLDAHKVPQVGLGSRGVPLFQLVPSVEAGETVASVLAVSKLRPDGAESGSGEFLVLLTRRGYVKRVPVEDVVIHNSRGKRVIGVREGDELKWVKRCREGDYVVIASRNGFVIKFRANERELRSVGRLAQGAMGVRFGKDDEIVDMDIVPGVVGENDDGTHRMLYVTRNGKGKRVGSDLVREQRRGRRGKIGMKLATGEDGEENDCLVAVQVCTEENSVMLVASDGTIVRTMVGNIPSYGRYSRGVRIQKLGADVKVAALVVLPKALADTNEDDMVDGEEVDLDEDANDEDDDVEDDDGDDEDHRRQ